VTTKTAAKTASKPTAKPAAKPAPAPAKGLEPVVTAVKEAKPSAKSSTRAGRGMPAAMPMPEPGPASRFADRFAPMRSARPVPVDEPVRQAVKFDPKLVNAWKGKAGRDLTEPELLAMPEAEYMNEKQLEFFRVRLTALKDDLLSNAGETTEHLREDTSIVPDPADRATIEEEHALELRTRDRERKLLKKISQSLARIEAGDYGYCDETGEPIGLARLLARPTATLSLEAQQRREMKQKMFGD
jgi:DnaK suppressor protein